jgi:hypothetical protein
MRETDRKLVAREDATLISSGESADGSGAYQANSTATGSALVVLTQGPGGANSDWLELVYQFRQQQLQNGRTPLLQERGRARIALDRSPEQVERLHVKTVTAVRLGSDP